MTTPQWEPGDTDPGGLASGGLASGGLASGGLASGGQVLRLPQPGWLPDPADTSPASAELERYWDGWNWTDHTRDRGTHAAHVPAGASAAVATGRPPLVRPWIAMLALITLVGVGAAAFTGLLSPWFSTGAKAPTRTAAEASVGYPVFGSDATVVYLAAALVSQQETIDVTWLSAGGHDAVAEIDDAMREALAQNPYAFASGWRIRIEPRRTRVFPDYLYPADEAERRRVATTNAVEAILADPAVKASADARSTASALHDAVLRVSTYDDAAATEIERGGRPEESARVAQSQEAYGALVGGSAVCNGYAQAFQLLATASGLTSVVVTGQATSGVTTGDHAWNRVLIDGEWLVVDTTWDDAQDSLPRRDYLLMEPSDLRLLTRTADDYWVVDTNRGLYE